MPNFRIKKVGVAGLFLCGALLGTAACGTPSHGHGYHKEGSRIANFEHPVVIAHPISDTEVESPLVLMGDATAYMGQVDYEVVDDESGTVVESGKAMSGSMGAFSKFIVELNLDPGSYTVTVAQPDPPERAVNAEPYTTSLSFVVSGKRAQ